MNTNLIISFFFFFLYLEFVYFLNQTVLYLFLPLSKYTDIIKHPVQRSNIIKIKFIFIIKTNFHYKNFVFLYVNCVVIINNRLFLRSDDINVRTKKKRKRRKVVEERRKKKRNI